MTTFVALLDRVRAGDEAAAAALIVQFEADIRRAVRVRLTDTSLRHIVDSSDICQSVLLRFFRRLAAERCAMQDPDEARRLLIVMVRNRIIDWVRKESSQKRDARRNTSLRDQHLLQSSVASEATPSRIVQSREELQLLYDALDDDIARLARCRSEGMSWNEIAEREGEDANTLRVRMFRSLAKHQRTTKAGGDASP